MILNKVAASTLVAGLILTLASTAAEAQQRTDYEVIVRIMRECAKIGDVPARVRCYDNTIGLEPQISTSTPPTAATPPPSAPRATGYGAESLPQTPAERSALAEQATLRVTRVEELAPRVYRLTLEDGGVWEFIEAASPSYDPPRAGGSITLERGALGGFLMDYARQPAIRIKRVR